MTTEAAKLSQKDSGRIADRAFWLLCVTAGVAVLAILAAILVSTVKEAFPAFSWEFFTSKTWVPNEVNGAAPQFGTLSFMYGTVVVALISLIFAVPVSIGIALFLSELAPRRLRGPVITVLDMLASVPSVVFGLWGLLTVAPALTPVYKWLHRTLGDIPVIGKLFGEPSATGWSFMTAGIVVAIMIIPIITSITREVFDTVPDADKQAAWALGSTRWEMIKGAVLPHSFGGIIGAIMLGLGRALGETVAVALIIGSSPQITANILDAGYTAPAAIMNLFGEAAGDFRAALIGMGVILFVITVLINLLARAIVRRTEIRMKGARA